MLKQAEIDGITHILHAKFVPANKSASGDMYWLVEADIRIYVERRNDTAIISTANSGADGKGKLLNIFHKTRHHISPNGGVVQCVQDHITNFRETLADTDKVFLRLSQNRRFEAMQRQQALVIAQVNGLIKPPGYITTKNNYIHVVFPTKGIANGQVEHLGTVVCDLNRSDAEVIELLTSIIQTANEKYVQHLIDERKRIDNELASHGIVQLDTTEK